MYSCRSVCTSVCIGCVPQLRCHSLPRCRRSSFPAALTCLRPYDEKSHEHHCVQTGDAISQHFLFRCCWTKIDSAVNLRETPSSEFVQCVLLVILLANTVESICCAVRHTVTLLRAVWRMICSPHSVWVLIAMTTDACRHQLSATHPTKPAAHFLGVVYYAVVTVCLLLSACCLPLATFFGNILGSILLYRLLFPRCTTS